MSYKNLQVYIRNNDFQSWHKFQQIILHSNCVENDAILCNIINLLYGENTENMFNNITRINACICQLILVSIYPHFNFPKNNFLHFLLFFFIFNLILFALI